MACIFQSHMEFKPSETFLIQKWLDSKLVQVDGLLKRVLALEELPRMDNQSVIMGEVVALRRSLLAKHRKTCSAMKDLLRCVLNKMTSSGSLLEISATAVLNYHLSTVGELPKEVELQLQEVMEKTIHQKNVIEFLEHKVPRLLSVVYRNLRLRVTQ